MFIKIEMKSLSNTEKTEQLALLRRMRHFYRNRIQRATQAGEGSREHHLLPGLGIGRVHQTHQGHAACLRQVRKDLEAKGIWVLSTGIKTLAEEMPEAYKDVDDVVEAVAGAGISKRVARLRPMGVVKG